MPYGKQLAFAALLATLKLRKDQIIRVKQLRSRALDKVRSVNFASRAARERERGRSSSFGGATAAVDALALESQREQRRTDNLVLLQLTKEIQDFCEQPELDARLRSLISSAYFVRDDPTSKIFNALIKSTKLSKEEAVRARELRDYERKKKKAKTLRNRAKVAATPLKLPSPRRSTRPRNESSETQKLKDEASMDKQIGRAHV